MAKLKIGVLGVSGHFARRVVLPVKNSDKIKIYGIASRTEAKAKQAAEKWDIPKYYGSYEELIKDDDIEAVYIPLPNHMHLEWIKKSVDAHKHVICEKPLAVNAQEVLEIIDYVKNKNVKVMEAFMYRFHPKWKRVKELVASGEIGKITAIHTYYAINNVDPNNIKNKKECCGGALMDIGCYAVSSACYIKGQAPKRLVSLMRENPVFELDCVTSGLFDFGDARALFTVTTNSAMQQEVKIYGTEGTITVTLPFNDYDDIRGELIIQTGLGIRSVTFEPVNQYRLEFEAFAEAIQENKPVPVSLEESYLNMKIIDALKQSNDQGKWVDIE